MQGFNMGRYVPPDQEGLTSANKLAGKHPLGARARNLRTTGALIVRFEMPFAVWCTTCKPHETIIGQGVRFNAEKKKVGNYYSTPIYSFRMKHTVCGGWIEIRTDPQNTAYVVVEGGRKRDTGDNKELQPGEIAIRLPGSGDDAAHDPFAKLEGKVEDKRRAQTETSRILELQQRQNRDWNDPYEQSKRLRRTFRTERKGLEKAEAGREALKDKMSLGIDLVDETEEDRQRAGMVDFGDDQDLPDKMAARATRVRPMFETRSPRGLSKSENHKGSSHEKSGSRKTRLIDQAAKRKASLRNALSGNTRAAVDPFLNDAGDDRHVWKASVKRKQPSSMASANRDKPKASVPGPLTDSSGTQPSLDLSPQVQNDTQKRVSTQNGSNLVSYASDSD